MSELEFDADLGRKLRQYGETKRQLKALVESTRAFAKALSAIGFGLNMLNDGTFTDQAKAVQAISELPQDLSLDYLRGLIAQCNEVRGRYVDLKSQMSQHGVEF